MDLKHLLWRTLAAVLGAPHRSYEKNLRRRQASRKRVADANAAAQRRHDELDRLHFDWS